MPREHTLHMRMRRGCFQKASLCSTWPLPPEFKLRIGDGEVQDFYLYSMDKVKEVLVSDDFK
ncbi:hypothetical protein J4Q44_G00260280, partial [Coregonus suidteri]